MLGSFQGSVTSNLLPSPPLPPSPSEYYTGAHKSNTVTHIYTKLIKEAELLSNHSTMLNNFFETQTALMMNSKVDSGEPRVLQYSHLLCRVTRIVQHHHDDSPWLTRASMLHQRHPGPALAPTSSLSHYCPPYACRWTLFQMHSVTARHSLSCKD